MDKAQEEKMKSGFSKKWGKIPEGKLPYLDIGSICERMFSFGYEACLEANGIGSEPIDDGRIPEGYYKPGEPIEIRDKGSSGDFMCAELVILNRDAIPVNHNRIEIRRVPAWAPKDDEAVLTPVMGRAEIGYIKGGFVLVRGTTIPLVQADVKQLDVDNLGSSWDEI